MYSITPKERLVSVKFEKIISAQDIEEYARSLRADPMFDPEFSEIVDIRDVEELEMSPEDAIELADRFDPFCPGVRRAFLVRTEFQMHAARMHQVLRNDERSIGIFPSMAEARKWLKKTRWQLWARTGAEREAGRTP